jgi:peptidoglycan/xylan/chitin deacetylase (PgdA/CDA1 family)
MSGLENGAAPFLRQLRAHSSAGFRIKMRSRLWSGIAKGFQLFAKSCRQLGVLGPLISTADKWNVRRHPSGGIAFPFVKKRETFPFQVLVYHRVNDDEDPIFGGVRVKVFRHQMEVLSQYFNVLPLEEVVKLAATADVPRKSIAITFDDGYRDNYENAFPILRELNLPATVFLTTGAVSSGTPLWHDVLFDAFRRTQVGFISIEGKQYPLLTPAERGAAVNAFRRYLRTYTYGDMRALLAELRSKLGVTDASIKTSYLSWREVKEMSQSQITFGAHTVNHPILTRMPFDEAVNEIIDSRDTIERELGSTVTLFAYPNGHCEDFNDAMKRVLREAGFSCAVTIVPGVNDVYTDPFELRRVSIWESDAAVCALRLAGYKFFS